MLLENQIKCISPETASLMISEFVKQGVMFKAYEIPEGLGSYILIELTGGY